MKQKRVWMWSAAALLLAACGGNTSSKNTAADAASASVSQSQPAPAFCGTYRGTVPAADCPGIELTLTLGPDGRYEQTWNYIEREGIFTDRGPYTVEGDLLTLEPDAEGGVPLYYKLEGDRLLKLDADRKPIEGELAPYYELHKIAKQ